jgi:uncharacterized protein YjiS (DUF1127 family)
MNNESSVVFTSIRNRNEMSAWVMRQWFNPNKHSEKAWYTTDVNIDNVLSHISRNRHFPLSPIQIADMWRSMPSIRSGLKMLTDTDLSDLDAFVESQNENEKKKIKYTKRDETFSAIGKEVGNITAPMIQRLERSAIEKFGVLCGGKNPMRMDENESESIIDKIDSARLDAAERFAEILKESDSIDSFFQALQKLQVITKIDVSITTQREKDTLGILSSYAIDTIIRFLLQDISRDNNVIKSYQSLVAHTVFPRRKGRPSVDDSDDDS